MLCLKANAADLSPACWTAVELHSTTATPAAVEMSPTKPAPQEQPTVRAKKPTEPARASVSPSPPSTAAAAAPQKPTAKQTSAIRAACRSDFVSRCPGVQPGGAAALQCLQRNAAELSPPCKSAVAAITKGEPAAPPATPSASARHRLRSLRWRQCPHCAHGKPLQSFGSVAGIRARCARHSVWRRPHHLVSCGESLEVYRPGVTELKRANIKLILRNR